MKLVGEICTKFIREATTSYSYLKVAISVSPDNGGMYYGRISNKDT